MLIAIFTCLIQRNNVRQTAIHFYSGHNIVQICKYVYFCGYNILQIAAQNGHQSVVKMLLDRHKRLAYVENDMHLNAFHPLSNKHLSDSSLPNLAATKDKEWLLLSTSFTSFKFVNVNINSNVL
jgi:hypothetical protein